MDLKDIRTLTLLSAFENENHPTQRELAQRLDVSLGLVNLYLKKLVHKSYFKVKTYPANRMGYLLTPKGIKEKTRLTYEYINYSLWFYSQTRTKLQNIMQTLKTQNVRTVALYGVNEVSEIAYLCLKESGIDLVAVVDDNKAGDTFLGQTIHSSQALDSISFDKLLDTTMPDSKDMSTPQALIPLHEDKILRVLQETGGSNGIRMRGDIR